VFESVKVRLPQKAEFLPALEIELLGFPNLLHDDIVDSITQYLIWAKNRQNFMPRIRRI
jgi:phage terminase large subunit-like protein